MPKGLITSIRDAVMPLLFDGWNEKQAGAEQATGTDLGFLTIQPRGPEGTIITPSNYESQVAANRGPVHAALNTTAKKVGAATLRIFRPKRSGSKSVLYHTRTRAISEARRIELVDKAGPGSVLALEGDAEEIVGGHRLVDLLTNVNSQYDPYQLKYITSAYLSLTGNCYWVLIRDNLGIPTAIWIAPAEFMRVKPDVNTFVAGYVYKHGQLKKEFAVDDVIHFRSPAPGVKFQFYGRGDLMGAIDDFNLLQQMYIFEMAIFRNGGIPATLLNVQGNWTEDQKTSFREQFIQRFGTSEKAGRPMVGENVTVEQLGVTPKDMGYQGARKFSNTNIYSNMGIPEAMMTGQVSTRAALEASLTQIAIFTVDPMLTLIDQTLNAQLIPLYKDPIYVEFDNVIPEDKEFILKEDTELVDSGIDLINEVRKRRGKEPIEGGDVAYQSFNRVPLGTEVTRQPSQATVDDIVDQAFVKVKDRMRGSG